MTVGKLIKFLMRKYDMDLIGLDGYKNILAKFNPDEISLGMKIEYESYYQSYNTNIYSSKRYIDPYQVMDKVLKNLRDNPKYYK